MAFIGPNPAFQLVDKLDHSVRTGFDKFQELTGLTEPIDHILESTERLMNVAGYLPFLSAASGALRSSMGVAILVTSIFLVTINVLKMTFAPRGICSTGEEQHKIIRSLDLAAHGVANIFRGLFESHMVGSAIFCFVYDRIYRMQHNNEARLHNVSPLFVHGNISNYFNAESAIAHGVGNFRAALA